MRWRGVILFPQVHSCLVGLQLPGLGVIVVTQGQPGGVHGEEFGRTEPHGPPGERADHKNPLEAVLPGVAVELFGMLKMLDVVAVPDAGELLSQSHGPAVEIQNGIRVRFLLGYVDIRIIWIYIKPGGVRGGEAGVGAVIPLHQGPGGVPGGAPESHQALFVALFGCMVFVFPAGLDILVHIGAFRPPVQHTDLLALVDEGGALLEQVGDCQHLVTNLSPVLKSFQPPMRRSGLPMLMNAEVRYG